MNRNYRSILFALCSLFGTLSYAQQVSMEEAHAKALNFLNQNQAKARKSVSQPVSLELAYAAKNGDESHFYIFNSANDGFVIVGGDEAAQEILGYSENGAFDYATAPDNLKWWLSQYSAQIQNAIADVKSGKAVIASQSDNAKARRKVASRNNVPDLITTKWGQDAPFNSVIPKKGNTNRSFVTGCTATAMAQVMKYYNYPEKGTGTKSYYDDETSVDFAADFENTQYDWDNMLDSYASYNKNQAQAVGTLMYHCGVSLNMSYDLGGSSASTFNIPDALATYFGYDKSGYSAERKFYTDEEWEDMIYNELSNGRPVIYGGNNKAYPYSGHAFVCHGYNAYNRKYAINWGWNGAYDGYFALTGATALIPNGTRNGSAEGGQYTGSQLAIFNIMPDKGGEKTIIAGTNGFSLFKDSQEYDSYSVDRSKDKDAYLTLDYSVYSYSSDTVSFYTGLMLKETTTGKEYVVKNFKTSDLPYRWGYKSLKRTFSTSIAKYNGTYEVYPAYSGTGEEGTWKIMRYLPGSLTVPVIIITGGEDDEPVDVEFSISDSEIMIGKTLSITHSSTYTNNIIYTSSDESVAKVSADGIITGIGEGTATITVEAEGGLQYNATKKTFVVNVLPIVKEAVRYSISQNSIFANETASILCEAVDYPGKTTYTISDESIAEVSETGVITAKKEGKVTITVSAEDTDYFIGTTTDFELNIKPLAERMEIIEMPVAGMKGYISPSNKTIPVLVKNVSSTSSQVILSYRYGRYSGSQSTYLAAGAVTQFYISIINQAINSFKQNEKVNVYFCRDDNDSIPYNIPSVQFTYVDDISIDYTLSQVGWGTICLPFDAAVPSGLTAYTVTDVNGSALVKEVADKIEMNKPYLVSGEPGTYTFSGPGTPAVTDSKDGLLYGNTEGNAAVYAPAGSYVLQNKATTGLGFYKVQYDNSQKVRPYSAYLMLESSHASKYLNLGETPTDIETVGCDASSAVDAPVYNLNGVRVGKDAKGVVIVNGKLIFKK